MTEFFWAASIGKELEDAALLFSHHALVGGADLHPMFALTCFTVIRVPVASMRVGVAPMKTAPLCEVKGPVFKSILKSGTNVSLNSVLDLKHWPTLVFS